MGRARLERTRNQHALLLADKVTYNRNTGVAADSTTGQILWVIASCVVLVAVFFPLATWAYRKKI